MKTNVKICGLRRPEDIEAVNTFKPEYIGFIFASKSRRYITPDKAALLKNMLHPGILAVGVFVNEDPEEAARIANEGIIDILQLHGGEDEEYIQTLRTMTKKPVIKAFSVKNASDLEKARTSSADLVLLDHGAGGTGESFDWSLLKGFGRPYFLAGGLNASNVTDAVKEYRPYAVDISSGVETDGYKDADKIRQCIEAVRYLNM